MAEKSKEIIAKTFLEILKENTYAEMTISEILSNTPLVRKTFYNNFSTKIDIVKYICKNLIKEYLTRLTNLTSFSLYTFSTTFFQYGKEEREIFTLLHENQLFYVFADEFKSQMWSINSIMPKSVLNELSEEDVSYVFAFHSSGMLAMFELWAKNGYDKPIEEMAGIYTLIVKEVRGN